MKFVYRKDSAVTKLHFSDFRSCYPFESSIYKTKGLYPIPYTHNWLYSFSLLIIKLGNAPSTLCYPPASGRVPCVETTKINGRAAGVEENTNPQRKSVFSCLKKVPNINIHTERARQTLCDRRLYMMRECRRQFLLSAINYPSASNVARNSRLQNKTV
jgi:hypothetical protein